MKLHWITRLFLRGWKKPPTVTLHGQVIDADGDVCGTVDVELPLGPRFVVEVPIMYNCFAIYGKVQLEDWLEASIHLRPEREGVWVAPGDVIGLLVDLTLS